METRQTLSDEYGIISFRMENIKGELKDTDYVVLKKFEGYNVAKYSDIFAKRDALRKEYDGLEERLNKINNYLITNGNGYSEDLQ